MSSSVRSCLRALLALLLTLGLSRTAAAQGSPPSNTDFTSTLQSMSAQTAAECLQAAAKLDEWAKAYADLQRTGGQLYDLFKTRPAAGDGDEALTAWVGKVDAVLKASAKLRKLIGTRIDSRVQDAGSDQATPADLVRIYEQEARAAVRAWALEWVGQIEDYLKARSAEFRSVLRYADQVQAKAKELQKEGSDALAAAKAYRDAAYQAVQSMRDPANYAKNFLDGEFRNNYLNRSRTISGAKITVIQADPARSIFSPGANIGVQIEYAQLSGFKLRAYGLYFRYRKGQLPEPRVDRIKVDATSLNSLASAGLKKLGDALPDFGLPIQIRNPTFTDFNAAGGPPKGSLQFGVVIALDKLLDFASKNMPSLEGDVVATADGRVSIASLKASIRTPVPIGTSGLIFDGGWIELRPQDRTNTVMLGTSIAPATGGKDGVSLDVKAGFGFPVTRTGISYQGDLVLGGGQVKLGTVKGVISSQKVTFQFDNQPGATPYTVHLEGELNREALTGKGSISTVLGIGKADGAFRMGFNGDGWMNLSSNLDIGGGLKAAANFSASYGPGFRNLKVDGALSLEANIDPLGSLEASLAVHAERDPRAFIQLNGTVAGQDFQVKLENFGALYDALKIRLLDLRGQIYDSLARGEKAAGKWAADREKALDQWLYANAKKAGLDRVSTGIPTIDGALGRASDALKGVGGDLSNFRDNLGKAAVNARQTAEDAGSHAAEVATNVASHPVESVVGFVQNPGRALGFGLTDSTPAPSVGRIGRVFGSASRFELGGGDVAGSFRRARDQIGREVNEALHTAQLNRRLDRVLNALDRQRVVKTWHPKSGQITELRLKFDRSLAHASSSSDAVITFGVQAAGFSYKLDAQGLKAAKPQTSSDFRVGEIHLSGLGGKGKAGIRIVLAKLKNVSGWDADKLVRTTLYDLIERELTGTQLGGRFEERRLAVCNHASEPIRVWVQTETRSGSGWQWLPGKSGHAYSFVIQPGKTVALSRERGDLKLTGRRVRLWAESESGRLWPQYQRKDLWLVDERDSDGVQRYFASSMQVFLYHFWVGKGERTFHERIVQVRNATDRPVQVWASSWSQDPNGKGEWDKTPKGTSVAPGKTVKLRQANGWDLRGSQTKLWAEQDKAGSFRWKKAWTTPLKQVSAAGYHGEVLQPFLYVLEPPGQGGTPPAGSATVLHLHADEVQVPSLKNLTLDEARAALRKVGLQPSIPTSAAPRAKVIAQSPASGWVAAGSSVRLTLHTVDERVRVPDFYHSTLESAQTAAQRVGLQVQQKAGSTPTTRHTKDRTLAGRTVIETQSSPKGEMVARGTMIHVTLARYVIQIAEERVQVPNFYHETLEAAQVAAQRVGLRVQVRAGATTATRSTKDRTLVGRTLIESQSVAHGGMVARGTLITVTLARYVLQASPPPAQIHVPHVRGKSHASAKAAVEAAGLVVRTVNSPAHGPVESVMPAEGTAVSRGATVTLVFPVRPRTTGSGPKTNPAPPPPPQGNLPGLWHLSQQRLMVRLQNGGTAEVGQVPAKGGSPTRWSAGRYSHSGNSFSVQGGSLNVRGTLRWLGTSEFVVRTSDGREYRFTRR
jgi:beta-lactam-binding protein with PASTA domain